LVGDWCYVLCLCVCVVCCVCLVFCLFVCCFFFFFFFFCRKDGYESLSSIGMVLAVDDGLRDGMDSISVFIIHPF